MGKTYSEFLFIGFTTYTQSYGNRNVYFTLKVQMEPNFRDPNPSILLGCTTKGVCF